MTTSKGCQRREYQINYGLETRGEKKKRTSKKTWMEGLQAAMTARNLEQDHWRNREECRLVSGRR
jgi:hypothetical protein